VGPSTSTSVHSFVRTVLCTLWGQNVCSSQRKHACALLCVRPRVFVTEGDGAAARRQVARKKHEIGCGVTHMLDPYVLGRAWRCSCWIHTSLMLPRLDPYVLGREGCEHLWANVQLIGMSESWLSESLCVDLQGAAPLLKML